jgi:NADH-quinone oxidoreductase subunit J
LLTRRDADRDHAFHWSGAVVALAVFGALLWAIFGTPAVAVAATPVEPLTVRRIGEVLMTDYVWPLQCIALVLTAALLGALVLLMEEKR